MSEFITDSLNQVASITMGQSPDSKMVNDKGNGLPFFQGNADFGKKTPVAKEWCTQPKKVANSGDILISVRAPVGEINLADTKSCIGRGLSAITAKTISRDYLYYYLANFSYELTKREQGSTFKAINRGDLDWFKVKFPIKRSRQNKIADILLTVDSCISQTEATISKLQKIKTGLIQDLFTRGVDANGRLRPSYREKPELYKPSRLGMIPKDWDCPKIIDVNVSLIDGDRGSNYPKSDDLKASGFCLFLNAGNVTQSGYNFSECQFITVEKDKSLRKGRVLEGDIVLTTRGTVGNMVMTTEDLPFKNIRINSGMLILRNEERKLKTEFLYHSLDKYIFQKEFIKIVSGSAQPQLPITDFKNFPLLIPSEPEQSEILKKINSILVTLDEEIKFVGKLLKVKNGLMQDLLTGKVDVKVGKDE